jgi:hypothetical protein
MTNNNIEIYHVSGTDKAEVACLGPFGWERQTFDVPRTLPTREALECIAFAYRCDRIVHAGGPVWVGFREPLPLVDESLNLCAELQSLETKGAK